MVHLIRRYSNQTGVAPLLDRCLAVTEEPPREQGQRPSSHLLRERLSDADRQNIVNEFVSGLATARALAQRYSVSDYSIRMILRQAGVPPMYSRTSPERIKQVRALWLENRSIAEIARQVGIGQTNVRLIVADADSSMKRRLIVTEPRI